MTRVSSVTLSIVDCRLIDDTSVLGVKNHCERSMRDRRLSDGSNFYIWDNDLNAFSSILALALWISFCTSVDVTFLRRLTTRMNGSFEGARVLSEANRADLFNRI